MATKKKKKALNNGPVLSPERLIKERMRGLEIGQCYRSDTVDFKDAGEGVVVVSRNHTGGRISYCCYLIDTYCFGLKDSYWSVRVDGEELDNRIKRLGHLHPCTYDEAHNWIYGAIAWADDAGIAPCKEWNLAQYFLEEDTDDIPLMELPFGKNGKHFFFANSQADLNRYIPTLRKNLGDEFDYVLQADEDNKEKYDDDGDDYDPFIELDRDYSYVHPPFPSELNLHHPELYDAMLAREPMWYIPKDDARLILELPHEELREDLEHLIRYALGRLYDGETTEREDAIIENASMLLGEVGNDTTSLSTLLETLKLSDRLFEQAFGDMLEKTIVPSICKLGGNQLNTLYDFMLEQGFDSMHKCYVSEAVSEMALQQSDRRSDIVSWYSRLLLQELKEDATTMVGFEGMGFVVCDLVDIQAKELLAEIEQVFVQDLVDTGVCGSFKSVKQDMLQPKYPRKPNNLDIKDRLEALNNFVEQNQNDK